MTDDDNRLREACDALEAKMRARPPAPSSAACMRCDDTGWETVGSNPDYRSRPVKRCRNGCTIPLPHHMQRKPEPASSGSRSDEEFS